MLRSTLLVLAVSLNNQIFFVSYTLYSLNKFNLEFVIMVDFFSLMFRRAVLIISRIVVLYSREYIFNEKFYLRFHVILLMFVFSIMLLIFSLNIISLILGWDSLGLTSYLLVIFYQSAKAANAGMLTALRNRVGDVFIIIRCAIRTIAESSNFFIINLFYIRPWKTCLFIIFLARITKRAQIPFSAWLPAAMAAPTPVSALVHSSTLVTAGVYLMIRFNGVFIAGVAIEACLWLGTLTILIAGMAALNEFDTKKIVALSTLRQLGLIISCLASSSFMVSYFHLITHAFIKAILFLSIGNLIHRSNDYQDIRKRRMLTSGFPISSSFILVANIGLAGTPFLAGFYSKDMWLEMFLIREINYVFLRLFFLRVFLTVAYRVRLMVFVIRKRNFLLPYTYIRDQSFVCLIRMGTLWVCTLICGNFLSWVLFKTSNLPVIRLVSKNVTIDIVSLRAILVLIMYIYGKKTDATWFSINLWGLPVFRGAILATIFLNIRRKFWVYVDQTRQIETFFFGLKTIAPTMDVSSVRSNLIWILKITLGCLLLVLILLY